jgi:predicted RNA polymerase sigma factor
VSYKIIPDLYCSEGRCKRPKETGREYCTPHIKLARAVGRRLDDEPEEDLTLALVRVQGRYRSHLAACAVDPRSRAYSLIWGESV